MVSFESVCLITVRPVCKFSYISYKYHLNNNNNNNYKKHYHSLIFDLIIIPFPSITKKKKKTYKTIWIIFKVSWWIILYFQFSRFDLVHFMRVPLFFIAYNIIYTWGIYLYSFYCLIILFSPIYEIQFMNFRFPHPLPPFILKRKCSIIIYFIENVLILTYIMHKINLWNAFLNMDKKKKTLWVKMHVITHFDQFR